MERKKSDLYCYMAELYISRYTELQDKKLLMDSIDLYNQAIRLDPECVKAYIGLSYLEYTYGQTKNAYMLLNKAKLIDPFNIQVNKLRQTIKKELDEKI